MNVCLLCSTQPSQQSTFPGSVVSASKKGYYYSDKIEKSSFELIIGDRTAIDYNTVFNVASFLFLGSSLTLLHTHVKFVG